jgi:hypothetical protein
VVQGASGSSGQQQQQRVCETWEGYGHYGEARYGWVGECYAKGSSGRFWPGWKEGLAHKDAPGSCPVCKGSVKVNGSKKEPKRF